MTGPTLPDAYTFRPPVLDDAAGVADLLNAVEKAINGVPDSSESKVRWQWDGPNIDLEGDYRVVIDPTGAVVGYCEYEALEPYDQLGAEGYVHPDHQGLGVGAAINDWVIRRARDDVPRAPDGARVVVRHFLWANDPAGRAFLEARGWEVCRWFYWMAIDLDQPIADPDPIRGIEIRPMRPGEERAVWAADDDAFQDHWGYATEPYDDWHHRHLEREGFDPALLLVAMDGDEIAGCALNYPTRDEDPDKGWVQFLGVRRPWRRRGIALALLQTSFAALQERGRLRAGLGVDAENPQGAVALYRKAGMRVDREAVSYEFELRAADGAPGS